MKALFSGVRMCVVAMIVLSVPIAAAADRKSGEVTLTRTKGYETDKHFKTALAAGPLRMQCRFYVGDFFGHEMIWAGGDIENKGDAPAWYSYHVAFFDARGQLLGASGQSAGTTAVEPGEKTQLASCLILLPDGVAEQAARFQVVLHELQAPDD